MTTQPRRGFGERHSNPRARLEAVYPARIDSSPSSRAAATNDVNMLVCTGGRQLSQAEWRTLFDAAELRMTTIVPTEAFSSVIEAVRA